MVVITERRYDSKNLKGGESQVAKVHSKRNEQFHFLAKHAKFYMCNNNNNDIK
jgi:hypothetical protein